MGHPLRTQLSPVSIFGPFLVDDSKRDSHMLTMSLTLAPTRIDARRHAVLSRFWHLPKGKGYIVRGLLDGLLPVRPTS